MLDILDIKQLREHVVKKVEGGVVGAALCGAYTANESCMQLQALTELRLLNRKAAALDH